MGSFKFVVFFVVVHYVRNPFELLITFLINGVFVHVGFDYMKLCQVPSAVALLFQPVVRVQVLEVTLC